MHAWFHCSYHWSNIDRHAKAQTLIPFSTQILSVINSNEMLKLLHVLWFQECWLNIEFISQSKIATSESLHLIIDICNCNHVSLVIARCSALRAVVSTFTWSCLQGAADCSFCSAFPWILGIGPNHYFCLDDSHYDSLGLSQLQCLCIKRQQIAYKVKMYK